MFFKTSDLMLTGVSLVISALIFLEESDETSEMQFLSLSKSHGDDKTLLADDLPLHDAPLTAQHSSASTSSA